MNVYISNEVKTMGNVDCDGQKFVKEANPQALHLKRLIIRQQSIDGFLAFADKFYVLPCFAVMFEQMPVSVVVMGFLLTYKTTLPCLLVLLPMLFFQAKITTVYNTILKVFRKEKQMMYISAFALVYCLASTACSVPYAPSLNEIVCATTFSYGGLYALSRYFVTSGMIL